MVLLAMLPLITVLAIMVGLMALVPLRLSLLNAVVLPSMLGLGVDGGVHMLHAVRERGSGQLYKVVRETGGAVAMCTLTSMMGFAGMLVAVHPGLRSIGALAIIGLLGCLFGAVVVLPIVLANLRGRVDK